MRVKLLRVRCNTAICVMHNLNDVSASSVVIWTSTPKPSFSMEIHVKFILFASFILFPGFSHDFIIYTLYLTNTATSNTIIYGVTNCVTQRIYTKYENILVLLLHSKLARSNVALLVVFQYDLMNNVAYFLWGPVYAVQAHDTL